ncbi:hypothetical protein Dimus_032713 [Dionaea muscipula]
MAKCSMYRPLLFLLAIILFFLETTNARDSQFFSKISRERTNTNTNQNNIHERKNDDTKVEEARVLPLPAEEQLVQEQEPTFLPQTNENNGYGLYGHETSLLPPSTMATASTFNLPFKPHYEGTLNNYNTNRNNDPYLYNMGTVFAKQGEGKGKGTTKEDQYMTNAIYYSPEYQALSGREYIDTAELRNVNAYNYNMQQQQQQKQGMSDTRNYYDAYSEKNVPSFGYSSYNNGYFNNKENANNGMQAYKDQEGQELTFEP